jgi:hypothetical protein
MGCPMHRPKSCFLLQTCKVLPPFASYDVKIEETDEHRILECSAQVVVLLLQLWAASACSSWCASTVNILPFSSFLL